MIDEKTLNWAAAQPDYVVTPMRMADGTVAPHYLDELAEHGHHDVVGVGARPLERGERPHGRRVEFPEARPRRPVLARRQILDLRDQSEGRDGERAHFFSALTFRLEMAACKR